MNDDLRHVPVLLDGQDDVNLQGTVREPADLGQLLPGKCSQSRRYLDMTAGDFEL